jgi:hypothetical protein
VIADHVWRPGPNVGGHIPPGCCVWLGKCARPPDDHITVPDFRARRGGR